MNPEKLLLILDAPPELEESRVDFLLGYDSEIEFSTFSIASHRRTHTGYSLSEQVTGRKKQQRFHIPVPKDRLFDLINSLKNEFERAGLEFRTLPLFNSGDLSQILYGFGSQTSLRWSNPQAFSDQLSEKWGLFLRCSA